MKVTDLVLQRLRNERLIATPFAKPEDVVRSLTAVQAQDYPAAKWGVGQRVRRCADADVEAAYNRGAILRTHVMRPTWHFVLPEDIRWLLALTAPRVKQAIAYYDRQLELDSRLFKRAYAAISKSLGGGKHATRAELGRVLAQAGIAASGQRLAHIMMHGELDALVCSGAMRGKQHTYALIDERAPNARTLQREEALGELTQRYFASHGPATARDFAWWSGLAAADVKRGLDIVHDEIASEGVDGKTYLYAPSMRRTQLKGPTIHLLPNYDEYLIAYKDRKAFFDGPLSGSATFYNVLARHIVVLNGRVIGGWRSLTDKQQTIVETRLFVSLDDGQQRALEAAAQAYGRFIGALIRVRTRPAQG